MHVCVSVLWECREDGVVRSPVLETVMLLCYATDTYDLIPGVARHGAECAEIMGVDRRARESDSHRTGRE